MYVDTIEYVVTVIMRTVMVQVVRANTPVCYSQTSMFDIVICRGRTLYYVATLINWIMRTIVRQLSSVCNEATHISLM